MTRSTGTEPVVVVGVDGSVIGRHAFQWALRDAALRRLRVRAMHVWSPPAPVSPIGSIISPVDVQASERDAKLLLERAVHEAVDEAQADPATVEAVAVRGYAPEKLLEAALDARLLVLGTRGRGGFGGLLLGSVSQQCASHSRSPVAIVPHTALLATRGDVVVGLDGSYGSRLALEWAIDEAIARGSALRAVHGWWVQHPVAPADVPYLSIDRKALIERSKRLLHEMVEAALAARSNRPVKIELRPLERPPARGLLEEAQHAGLVVVGSRGRGGFRGLLLGSVSQQCVNHAPCTVVVVPTPPSNGAPHGEEPS